MVDELRTGFHEELNFIREDVLKMAQYVIEMIPQITEAFLEKDKVKAQKLIDADEPLDIASVALDERCCQALALQQPMAKDLRQIISAMSINNDIERSGDLAVNVAKSTFRLEDATLTQELRDIILQMSEQAQNLIKDSMVAYTKEDVALADKLGKTDDILDDLNYDCLKAALNANTAGSIDLKTAIQIALIGRYYERIGDHAVNIGERIHYMVTGDITK